MAPPNTSPIRHFAIRQLCTAGQQFTGGSPGTTPVWKHGNTVYEYPTSASAGLIDPSAANYPPGNSTPLRVEEFVMSMGSPSSWSVYQVDASGAEILWISGTTETSVQYQYPDTPRLLPGEKLKVVTVGASTAQRVQVEFGEL